MTQEQNSIRPRFKTAAANNQSVQQQNEIQRAQPAVEKKSFDAQETGPNDELARVTENRRWLQSWNRNCD
jgi:hypothetical protein